MKQIKSIMWFTGSIIFLVIEKAFFPIVGALVAVGSLSNLIVNLICDIKPKLHPTIKRCNND